MTNAKHVKAGQVSFGNDLPLTLIAGPCQLENRDHGLMMATALKELTEKLGIGFVFKASFDKANRTSLSGVRGIGLDDAILIFKEIKDKLGVAILTDVHEASQCEKLVGVVDVLQIPAFLCRQTALLVAAGESGAIVNIKKGQFLAPWDMRHVVGKLVGALAQGGGR